MQLVLCCTPKYISITFVTLVQRECLCIYTFNIVNGPDIFADRIEYVNLLAVTERQLYFHARHTTHGHLYAEFATLSCYMHRGKTHAMSRFAI